MFLIPANRKMQRVFEIYYSTLRRYWLTLIPCLVLIATVDLAVVFFWSKHESSAIAEAGLAFFLLIVWIAYVWLFTYVFLRSKGLPITPVKTSLPRVFGIGLVTLVYEGIVDALSSSIESKIAAVLLFFVGSYLVYIWFTVALASIAEGSKFRICVRQSVDFLAEKAWLVIAFLFVIFLFHYSLFFIPYFSISVILRHSASGNPLFSFLWLIERLLVLPLATVVFVERRSVDSVQGTPQ